MSLSSSEALSPRQYHVGRALRGGVRSSYSFSVLGPLGWLADPLYCQDTREDIRSVPLARPWFPERQDCEPRQPLRSTATLRRAWGLDSERQPAPPGATAPGAKGKGSQGGSFAWKAARSARRRRHVRRPGPRDPRARPRRPAPAPPLRGPSAPSLAGDSVPAELPTSPRRSRRLGPADGERQRLASQVAGGARARARGAASAPALLCSPFPRPGRRAPLLPRPPSFPPSLSPSLRLQVLGRRAGTVSTSASVSLSQEEVKGGERLGKVFLAPFSSCRDAVLLLAEVCCCSRCCFAERHPLPPILTWPCPRS